MSKEKHEQFSICFTTNFVFRAKAHQDKQFNYTMKTVEDELFLSLLNRSPIQFDEERLLGEIEGKRVLVTGAGGSIGSALSQRLKSLSPAQLILLDHSENELYHLGVELEANCKSSHVMFVLGDVCDKPLLDEVFIRHRPQVVFHAAAFKHVPLSEQHPLAVIHNNVIGTYLLADGGIRHGVERLVLLSTDKAVNSVSIMGASKRFAELILLGTCDGSTRSIVVRFGNVLGSRGSVVPRFSEQLAQRLPLTVSHPEASRFFMSAREATELIIGSLWLSSCGNLFVPDLQEPVRILLLAERMIEAAGCSPGKDIPITFSGLRSGEKLSEELISAHETAHSTAHPRVRSVESPVPSAAVVRVLIAELQEALARRDRVRVLEIVREAVPEYQPGDELLAVIKNFAERRYR